MKMNHLTPWLIMALLTLLALCMFIIIKHSHTDTGRLEKICNRCNNSWYCEDIYELTD
jgi:hypothetical protein